jgi:hypothetical protein
VYHVTIYPFIDNSTFPIGILQVGGGGGGGGGSTSSNISFKITLPSPSSSNISVSYPNCVITTNNVTYRLVGTSYPAFSYNISIQFSSLYIIISAVVFDVRLTDPFAVDQFIFFDPPISVRSATGSNISLTGSLRVDTDLIGGILSSNGTITARPFSNTVNTNSNFEIIGISSNIYYNYNGTTYGAFAPYLYVTISDTTNLYFYTVEIQRAGNRILNVKITQD